MSGCSRYEVDCRQQVSYRQPGGQSDKDTAVVPLHHLIEAFCHAVDASLQIHEDGEMLNIYTLSLGA